MNSEEIHQRKPKDADAFGSDSLFRREEGETQEQFKLRTFVLLERALKNSFTVILQGALGAQEKGVDTTLPERSEIEAIERNVLEMFEEAKRLSSE